ncbi:Zinc transporter ZIP9-A [Geodia barretti]|nr:Zinc transporter ZIP9-A [Geodia barretti]
MGLSLLLGFIFMLFVDQVGGGHSHAPPPGVDVEVASGTRHRRHNLTATIGLVVHAAADGLALGAAAGLSKVEVQLIIFLAIMLHKAPAAFGFTSFLIHEGYDKATAKKHLLVFALAAPLAAFLSYFGLVRIMYVVQLPITGVAMLFSAGTFLYVATVHVLNELVQGHTHSPADASARTTAAGSNKLSHLELLLLTTGALLPLTFSILHSH